MRLTHLAIALREVAIESPILSKDYFSDMITNSAIAPHYAGDANRHDVNSQHQLGVPRIRTTMNFYGDVTDEMSRAASKVAGLALNGAQAERKAS
jgi:hypothetical protein